MLRILGRDTEVLPGQTVVAHVSRLPARHTWSTRPDSNRRPSRWQRDALPAELLVQTITDLTQGL